MMLSIFTACAQDTNSSSTEDNSTSTTTAASTTAKPDDTAPVENTANSTNPLVISTEDMSDRFTGFFSQSVPDQRVTELVDAGLIGLDRDGLLVYKGIEGETREYNGTDYLYTGLADVTVTRDEAADTTTYSYKLKDGVKFSDGHVMDADDMIFSFYVYCDPSYDGFATMYSLPIQGLKNYRTQTSDEVYETYAKIADAALAAGADFTGDSADFTAQQYADYYSLVKEEWIKCVQMIVDTCNSKYLSQIAPMLGKTEDEIKANDGLKIAVGMVGWGFGDYDEATGILTGAATGNTWNLTDSFPTIENYYEETYLAYEADVAAFIDVETTGAGEDPVGNSKARFISEFGSKDAAMGGAGIPNITGIKKVSDREVTITINGYDAAAIYRMSIQVSPMHYYGSEALYDYDNNKFGFPYGDLSSVHAKDRTPLGAGPYKLVKYENKIVYFEANEHYFEGAPLIKYVQFKTTTEADNIPGIPAGTIDVSSPSVNKERYKEIAGYNSNGEITGDTITVSEVDYLGYGYIGMNSKNVNVGGVIDSDASKNLRKAIATVLAVYRDLTVSSFYGDTASVINYPISNTSWAAPQKSDPGYVEAFSVDASGNSIYTSDMNADARYEAAKKAALSFLEAAGYTLNADKTAVVSAPEGARLEYELIIPGGGKQDHPSFALATAAQAALAEIGMTLKINDPADSNQMWNAMDAGTADLWCAAWGATSDPDMYQIYHSDNILAVYGGSGGGSNRYSIIDPQLDEYIMTARVSEDQTFRKGVYKDCLDIVMDWAVEIPVYQRKEVSIFSTQRVDTSTLLPDLTSFFGWRNGLNTLSLR